MKTIEEVDMLMLEIPEQWRYRWCGGERGLCACMGCVQIGNRLIMFRETHGFRYTGDPEYIDESKIPQAVYDRVKITKEEWLAWCERYPEQEVTL